MSAQALLPYPEPRAADQEVTSRVQGLWNNDHKFVVLSGPPGTGKTRAAEDVVALNHFATKSNLNLSSSRVTRLFPDFRLRTISDEEIVATIDQQGVKFVWDIAVLHPQYAYEDLIRGYRLEATESANSMGLKVREGILGFISRVSTALATRVSEAAPNSTLILDEFNRAPIGQLFGEAIYSLDRRGQPVSTPYSLDGVGPEFIIPDNLQIIGTMNSIDRGTSHLDLALRRRFASIGLTSNRLAVEQAWERFGDGAVDSLHLYDALKSLITSSRQAGEVPTNELVLGHSYFIPPTKCHDAFAAKEWLWSSYVYRMLPALVDYANQGLIEFHQPEVLSLPGGKGLNFQDLAGSEPNFALQQRS